MFGPLVPPGSVAPPGVRRTLRASLADGVAYAAMVGLGETYFLADAIRLHASALEVALLVTLPLCVGGIGPIAAFWIVRRARRCRPLVVLSAAAQSLILGALAAGTFFDAVTPVLLIAAACLYHIFGQAAGTTWATWIGDLVPLPLRAHYFPRRQSAIHLATFLALVTGGVALEALEPARDIAHEGVTGGNGFLAIFAAAALARAISTAFLAAMPEPEFTPLPSVRRLLVSTRTSRGRGAARLLGIAAAMNLAVYVGAPYFGPYILRSLGVSYLEYMIASGTSVVSKVIALGRWGRALQRFGPLQVYLLAMLLVGIVPLPWLWSPGYALVLLGMALSGFSWGGFEVAQFTLLLESSYRVTRQFVFALHSIASGTTQLAGGLVGAWVFAEMGGSYTAVFAASIGARLLCAALAPRLLVGVAGFSRPEVIGRRTLLLRVIGFREAGGLDLRPMPVLGHPHLAPPPAAEPPPPADPEAALAPEREPRERAPLARDPGGSAGRRSG